VSESDTVRYFQHPGGAVSELTATDPVIMPEGAKEITARTYAKKLAAIREATDTQVAELEEAGRVQRRADYDALTALGLPEESARRMSGWQEDAEGGTEGPA
jgi:hypothetical protein